MPGEPVMVTDALDPNAEEFAGIRADLGRLFIRHKHDLSLSHWSDAEIAEHAGVITSALIELGKSAKANGDTRWLLRHKWWFAAVGRLFDGERAAPLDS
jgi:hypothetical protein